jgi:ATP-binding cassette subfamily B protein
MDMFGGGRGGFFHRGDPSNMTFAGIPEELRSGVERVTRDEPEHALVEVPFSQHAWDRRPLTMRRLLAPERRPLALALLLIVIETGGLQVGPTLTKIAIDRGIVPKKIEVVVVIGVLYVAIVLLSSVAGGLRTAWTGRIGQRILYGLRLRVFGHQQRLSLDFYSREKAGVIMTRMTSDIETLNDLFRDGFPQLIIQGLTIAYVTVFLLVMNLRLALITILGVVPVLVIGSLWFRSASDAGYLRVRDGIAGVLSDLAEGLAGIRVTALHNRQLHNILHHRNVVGEYRDANEYTAQVNSLYAAGSQGLGLLGQAVILLIGGRMVLRGQLTVGELTAFLLYLTAFFVPIQGLVQFYNQYQQGKAAVFKLRRMLEEEPSVPESPQAQPLPAIVGQIRLDGVSFGYDPAELVLRDVDLEIAAGETFSLVGPTGAGKSTIAKLVTRFYDPVVGTVTIDGHDLRDVTLESLRRQLGVVPQEPFLFSGSIRDNVAFSRPDASDEEVVEALQMVGMWGLVESLPGGIQAYVHERGSSLSAGERQLLALARTFLSQPRVVVLDEATSNLDLQSESKVERALDVLLEGRTAIIIAHRLSTAMRADRIAVVDGGRIVECGPHDELVALRGVYHGLYMTWLEHTQAEAA